MSKKKIYLALLVLIVVGFVLYLAWPRTAQTPAPTESNENLIFYYGDSCPHCAIVEEFLLQEKVEEKIKLTKKEVYKNTANTNELVEKAKACNLDTKNLGVPFLWDSGSCYLGDQDIINILKQKIQP